MSGRKQSPPERAAQIDAFIRAHYDDPGLGAALLSERLGLSTAYLFNEVAQQTGFTNRRTMARAFQRYTGTSPGAYREREREGYKNQKNRP